MAAVSLTLPGSRLWRKYNLSLRHSPVVTKSVTCMAAYVLGDLSAQVASSRARRWQDKLATVDAARTARVALYGLLWCGPAGHRFYRWLDKTLMPGNPTAVAAVAGKVGVDQALFLPLSTAVFFAWVNLAAGAPANIPGDLSQKFAPSVRAAWALWVPAMTVNMALVPPPLRIVWINAMVIVWTNILSSMASKTPAATSAAELPEPLDLSQLAEQLLSPAPEQRRSPRGTRELHAHNSGSRQRRSTNDGQAAGRSPRGTAERAAAAAAGERASTTVIEPQGAATSSDSPFDWLFGLARGPDDDDASRRVSLCETEDPREACNSYTIDTQALLDADAADAAALTELTTASNELEGECAPLFV